MSFKNMRWVVIRAAVVFEVWLAFMVFVMRQGIYALPLCIIGIGLFKLAFEKEKKVVTPEDQDQFETLMLNPTQKLKLQQLLKEAGAEIISLGNVHLVDRRLPIEVDQTAVVLAISNPQRGEYYAEMHTPLEKMDHLPPQGQIFIGDSDVILEVWTAFRNYYYNNK